jgi:hypothetical protein
MSPDAAPRIPGNNHAGSLVFLSMHRALDSKTGSDAKRHAMRLLFALFLLPCCALAQDVSTVAATTAACGPKSVQFDVKTNYQPPSFEPNPSKAVVFVAESFAAAGNGLIEPTLKLGLDGNWIGATKSNSWLSFTLDPGEHHLCVRWQSRLSQFSHLISLANFAAEPGKVYYFRSRILSLDKEAILDLDPINEDQGRYLVVSSPQSEPHLKK